MRSDKEQTLVDAELQPNKWDRSRKEKIKFCYTMTQFYDYYKYNNEEKGTAKADIVTRPQFNTFIKTYLRLVIKRIIHEGFIFIMPHHIGRFYMHKTNRCGFITRLGKPTLNLHSFRKHFTIKWDKETAHMKNRNLWRSDLAGIVKVWIAEKIFDNNKPIIKDPLIGHNHNEKKW